MQKAIDAYLDSCQSFAERSIDSGINDEILVLGLPEARRYSKTREVRSLLVSEVSVEQIFKLHRPLSPLALKI